MLSLSLRAGERRPAGPLPHLHRAAVVPASREETFAFFADAVNLERLTPPWLNFSILTPTPIAMEEGTIIDYRVLLRGVPMAWRSRIDVWEPGVRFVDREVVGPYLWWRHEHRFEPVEGGTRVVDDVEYLPRAQMLAGWFVQRELKRIFDYRRQALQALFPNRTS